MRVGSRSLGESPSSIATKCRQCFSAIPSSADEVCKEPDCQSNRGAGPQSCHQAKLRRLVIH
jgi:hypothetical protein